LFGWHLLLSLHCPASGLAVLFCGSSLFNVVALAICSKKILKIKKMHLPLLEMPECCHVVLQMHFSAFKKNSDKESFKIKFGDEWIVTTEPTTFIILLRFDCVSKVREEVGLESKGVIF